MVRCTVLDAIVIVFFSAGVTGQYENCTGELNTIKDGKCDIDNNSPECNYDGGDCCRCSCKDDRHYPCGIVGFNCTDPDMIGNGDDCYNKTASVRYCASDAPGTWLVNDTASALSLAEAVNCSGGTFNVTWLGSVFVNRTLYIPNNTTLYVTGEGLGAEVNGGGKTRLFMAVGAQLHLESLILRNGNATYGGAIAAIRSDVYLNQTTCSGNNASSYGGAIYVGMSSAFVSEGHTVFTGNHAGEGGGAVAIQNSKLLVDGVAYFIENTARDLGGALILYWDTIASWSGETFFISNTAQHGGAMLVVFNSTVSWYGNTSFVDNVAGDDGGALYVDSDSSALWYGDTSFVDNAAGDDGGALVVYSDSSASWYGDTSFVENKANYAGALLFSSGSFGSWHGGTLFFNNTSGCDGGVLYVYSNSIVKWEGETLFINNSASCDGGAMYINSNSYASWDGEMAFVDNTADDGGALFIFVNSHIRWDGKTSFVNNIADEGGALYAWANSIISCNGKTFFTANNAISSGGAIYAGSSSNITVGGDTTFTDNEAGTDGGVAYVGSSNFMLDDNSTILFLGNICGGNGGAIAFVGDVYTRWSPFVTFSRNTAGGAGGAMYMSGVNFGMRFEGTRFISNSAAIGGGLYSTSTGNLGHDPTTYVGCEFIENHAAKTGGAIDSGAGRDNIVNTYFRRNTASLGGALRLVGRTSIVGCEFAENLSGEDDGPGISNDGIISNISRSTFIDNVFNCLTGFFLDYNETRVPFDTVCKGCDIECSGCTIKGKDPMCLKELEHSMSAGGNTTLVSLLIEAGYWRATNTSMDILACYNTDACLGGLTGGQGYCRKGYEGPYCSVCSKGFAKSLGFACNKCSDSATGGITLAVVMAIVLLLACAAFLSYMISGKMENTDHGIVARVSRFIPLQSVKIVIVVWQILTQFSTVANVVFPSVYQTFLDGVDILNFDLSWILSAECLIDTDFHDQLLLATLGPLGCLSILGVTYISAMHRNRASGESCGIVNRKHLSMVLLLTFLVYSSVSSTLFKTFACDKLDDGKNYLRADYRIECTSSKHKALEIYAAFMVILYVIGIPTFYGVLLYNNREALMNTDREEEESIKPITDLWKPYRPDRFYYEVIECIRRVMLTGALVFIYPNTAAQIAVALMIAAFFMIVSEALAPNISPWDTWCSRTGHAIVYTSMFLALLLKVDVSGERASSQRVFESVLIAAHSCLILIVVAEAIAMVVSWREEVKEDTEPWISLSLGVVYPDVRRGRTVLDNEPPPCYEDVAGNILR